MQILKPLYFIGRIFKPLVLWAYKIYITLKQRVRRSFKLGLHFINLFTNRKIVIILVFGLSVFVISANILQAQEIKNPDFGQHSAFASLLQPEGEGEIIETADNLKPQQKKYIPEQLTMLSSTEGLGGSGEVEAEIIALSGSTLVKENVLETQIGQRSEVLKHEVESGETLGEIAERYGITTSTLLWANDLTSKDYIKPGQVLNIPPVSGIMYTIASGDSLDGIIKKYQGDKEKTIALNQIGTDELLPVGKEIVIADGIPYTPPVVAHDPTVAVNYQNFTSIFTPSYKPSVTGGKLNWPVGCRNNLTTYWGHPNRARDIACSYGTPIYAAESGTAYISFSGSWGHGYGNTIDIRSANGLMTRYAHMSSFNVNSGQYVNRGDVIGFVGMTGRTSGPHLHFEVLINGVAVDPINYLY